MGPRGVVDRSTNRSVVAKFKKVHMKQVMQKRHRRKSPAHSKLTTALSTLYAIAYALAHWTILTA